MTELRDLLDRATAVDDVSHPVASDLLRGRAALTRQRRRRSLGGAAALTVVALAGAGLAGVTHDSGDQGPARPGTHGSADGTQIRLVAANLDAGVYTIGKVPEGWAVQDENAFRVTIAPTDGSVSDEPDDFAGKLVVMYDQNPLSGKRVAYADRIFYLRGDSGYTTIAVETRTGEPQGEVVVQYPDSTWSRELMLEFADAIGVGDAAQPGLG